MSVFDGLTFCVSGKFTKTQGQMKDAITDNGGSVAATVNAKVDYLVASGMGTGKTGDAEKKGKPVVTESWVDEAIESGTLPTDPSLFLSVGTGGAASGSGAGKKKAVPKKSKKAESEDESESEEEEKPKRRAAAKSKAKAKAKAKAKGTKRKAAESDDDDDDEEEEEPPKKRAKRAPAKATKKSKKDEEESDDSDDDMAGSSKSGAGSGTQKTEIVKGRAPVDPDSGLAGSHHVYEEGADVWDAMLNQTNIANNNNKYYVVQLLEADAGGKYVVWTKWGRVGKIAGRGAFPCSSLASAKTTFNSKFSDKTKNQWANRANFKTYSGKYTYLERDYSVAATEDETEGAGAGSVEIPESKLDTRVQDLVRMICDLNMMKKQMVEIGYDAEKLPLGKLSKKTLKQGYEVLKEIADLLEDDDAPSRSRKLTDLSSEFYTLIPHAFPGISIPPVIKTPKMLKDKLEMVAQLQDIEVASKLLQESKSAGGIVNPVDSHYAQLKCAIQPIEVKSDELELIKTYVKNTHGKTHTQFGLEVLEAFALDREGEPARFQAFEKTPNRQLLWHGSRLTNFVGIISQGLRIAPPEAPVTGYMFGKGVYFADMVSKSANYCCTSKDSNIGLMLLCEVALGEERELTQADYYADRLPKGKLSTKGVGTNMPDPKGAITLENGTIVPCGKASQLGPAYGTGTSLLYNEFIVYDTAQVRMKYLVKMKFNYGA